MVAMLLSAMAIMAVEISMMELILDSTYLTIMVLSVLVENERAMFIAHTRLLIQASYITLHTFKDQITVSAVSDSRISLIAS